jgi:penicillin-binding protein 1A
MRLKIPILLFIFAFLPLLAIGAFTLFFLFYVPSIDDFTDVTRGETSILYDRTGEHVLYQIHGEENRKPLSNEEIPNFIRLATIAVEDENFYSHYGVDPRAIFRALRVNIEEGGFEQGASTITQQLARSVVLTREKTIERKVIEAYCHLNLSFFLQRKIFLTVILIRFPMAQTRMV